MTCTLLNVAFDCANPYELAQFWQLVTGCPFNPEDHPGDPEASIQLENGVRLWFNQVPEPKIVKNRVHVCMEPQGIRDEEVAYLLERGATIVADRRQPDGTGWAVLTVPEGNECCVLRSEEEFTNAHQL